MDFVALHHAAKAGNIADPVDPPEHALQRPVLQRLEIIERVDRPPAGVLRIGERVAVNFARGSFRRKRRNNTGGQLGGRQPVQHILLRLVEVHAIIELAAQMSQLEQRAAAGVGQARHAGQRSFQRNRDQPLDFFRRRAGILRDDLDDRRGRIGIGFHIDMEERIQAAGHQRQGQQNHDRAACGRPGDELVNHSENLSL